MRFTLDRSLPVPLGVQLRGKIRYGITYGELQPGERLPSVREMAAQVGVAPMTVATVYRELQDAELLETRPGSGTFVSRAGPADPRRRQGLQRLRFRIDALLRDAAALGLDAAAIVALVNMRLTQASEANGLRLILVGLFEAATADYAMAIRAHLPGGDTIASVTLDALRRDPAACLRAASADLVLTVADRRSDVASLLGPDAPPIVPLNFLPADHVRARLAALDPMHRVVAVSLFPEWLAIMTSGIARFAPHVARMAATVLDSPDLGRIVANADVVVYATGAEAVLGRLPDGTAAVEYRHAPDPGDIERTLLPLLETMRRKPAAAEEASCESAK